MLPKPPAATTAKIRKLAQLTQALERGEAFMVTRLTTIKSLCADPLVAAHFAHYIARHALRAMLEADRSARLSVEQRIRYQQVMAEVIARIDDVLAQHTSETMLALSTAVHSLEQMQNQYQRIYGEPVRLIDNTDALTVESAGRCVLAGAQAGYWAYQAARSFAERYDPSYGTGLIPASAPDGPYYY